MPSNINQQLGEIKQLIIHGQYQEVLDVIEQGSKKKGISKIDEISFLALKCNVLNDLGKHEEALKLADSLLNKNEIKDHNLLKTDILYQKSTATFFSPGRRYTEALNITEQALELLETIQSDIPSKDFAERKAWLLILKGMIIQIYRADFSRCTEIYLESLSFAEKSGNKQIITRCKIVLFYVHFRLGKSQRAEEYLIQAKKTAEEINNKLELAMYYFNNADFLAFTKREYEQAIESQKKALAFLNEINSTYFIAGIYFQLGHIYKRIFQLDEALECYKKSLEKGDWVGHYPIQSIAYTYYLKYDLQQAKEYYLRNLKICEEMDDIYILSGTLYNLIFLEVELNNLEQAKNYLNQFKQLSDETGLTWRDRQYRFARILVTKASGNISDLSKAAELLNEFLAERDLPSYHRLNALYLLLEIRIKELQLSPNKDTLLEVQKRLNHLEVEAEDKPFLWLLANVYRLQSRLALIELDAQKAIELLDKAQTIAEDIKVVLLKKKIDEDREKIDQQLNMLNKLQEQKSPINETIKLVSLESTVKNIKQETVLEDHDESGQIIEYRKLFALKI